MRLMTHESSTDADHGGRCFLRSDPREREMKRWNLVSNRQRAKRCTVVDLWRYHWVRRDQTKPEVRKEGERVVECSFVSDKWYATRDFSLLENRWFDWRDNRGVRDR